MKPKIIIAIAMATLMVLLALSSVIGEQQNSSIASGTKSLSNASVEKAIMKCSSHLWTNHEINYDPFVFHAI